MTDGNNDDDGEGKAGGARRAFVFVFNLVDD